MFVIISQQLSYFEYIHTYTHTPMFIYIIYTYWKRFNSTNTRPPISQHSMGVIYPILCPRRLTLYTTIFRRSTDGIIYPTHRSIISHRNHITNTYTTTAIYIIYTHTQFHTGQRNDVSNDESNHSYTCSSISAGRYIRVRG